MILLKTNEYNEYYFDGRTATLQHNAGYSSYERSYVKDLDLYGEDSFGEQWKDRAKKIFDTYNLLGKKVLDIGCAKGFMVEDLRSFGADAWGTDISSYAIGKATSEVAPYLTIGDVRTDLSKYSNKEFGFIFGRGILSCLTDQEAIDLANECLRISSQVVFIIFDTGREESYNIKSIQEWQSLLPKGVVIIARDI